MYKNLRIVPCSFDLCLFTAMRRLKHITIFFAIVKASLCSKKLIRSFDLRLGKDMYIGSDEEQALVNAIASHFPASNQFLCTNHLKDGTLNYMQ